MWHDLFSETLNRLQRLGLTGTEVEVEDELVDTGLRITISAGEPNMRLSSSCSRVCLRGKDLMMPWNKGGVVDESRGPFPGRAFEAQLNSFCCHFTRSF